MEEWERLPLPLASLGLRLGVRDSDQWHRALTFVEAMLGLAFAYGLAVQRRDQHRLPPWAELKSALAKSSLGHRVELLHWVHSGWTLDAPAPECSQLVRAALGEAQMPKRRPPSVRQAFEALVVARNQLAHPSLPSTVKEQLLDAFVAGAAALAKSNSHFARRLLRCDGFSATSRGTPGVVAAAMTGLGAIPYRQGRAVEVSGVQSVGQLFLLATRDGDPALDLQPFVVADGDDVLFLVGAVGEKARFWSPTSRRDQVVAVETLYGGGSSSISSSPSDSQPELDAPRAEHHPPPLVDGRPRWGLWVGGGAALVAVLLVGGALMLGSSPVEQQGSTPSSTGSAPAHDPSPENTAGDSPNAEAAPRAGDPILVALFDVPLPFGAPLQSVEPLGTEVRSAHCRGDEEPLPGQPWAAVDLPTSSAPGHQRAVVLVDAEGGLFEVNVYSNAEPAAVAGWVESELREPPTAVSQDRSWYRWRFGARQVNVARNRYGKTMIIAFHDPKKIAFGERRRELCAPR